MFDTPSVSYAVAFGAGLLSFFTPCVLPLIPVYFTLITGLSLENLTQSPDAEVRARVIFSTIAYVLGFSAVFILLGASAFFLGSLINQHLGVLRVIGGVVIVVLGIHMTGVITIPGLQSEKRVHVRQRSMSLAGAFLVGALFAAGWTPCIGPILGSILIVAGSQETALRGMLLLSAYSAGLALPFLLLSFFINALISFIRRTSRVIKYINIVAGVLLIGIGIVLISGVW
ncbi:MAG: cytochrome c biogenesis protein CcdA [Thermodesulfobacteriota bacterium]|nr:cytochrome c biogenesis protein CcdA [Thermodesulfobacteriota bacterium]